MQKGQLSFDLLMTIIVALIFIASFQSFSHQFTDSEKIITIQNQEKIIAENLKTLLDESTILIGEGSLYSIKYRIPEMFEPGKPTGQECNISFADNGNEGITITIDYELKLSDLSKHIITTVDAVYVDSVIISQVDGQTINCGSLLELSNLP